MYSGELRAIFVAGCPQKTLSIQDFFGYSGNLRDTFRLTKLDQSEDNSGVQFKNLNKYAEK